jgi:hypothetical protein
MQRVTPEQAAVFAKAAVEGPEKVWYEVAPELSGMRDDVTGEKMTEFYWLRDLALDHAELTAALAACEADYAAIVCTLKEVKNRYWDEYRTELAKNALSTPRAVAALKEGR